MLVADLIKQLEPYKDFTIDSRLHLEVREEILDKRMYKFPHDNYDVELSIDDIGYSDKVVCIGVTFKDN